MNKYKDTQKWGEISEKYSLKDLLKLYNTPSEWRENLLNTIQNLPFPPQKGSIDILEAGSSFGTTSALLPDNFNITLVDVDDIALKKASEFYNYLQKDVFILKQDIFDLHKLNKKYDIVYNAGVIEHFNKAERNEMLFNMASITNDSGYILVSYPNHNCLPYWLGYWYQLITRKWIYTKEYKINISAFNEGSFSLKIFSVTDFDKKVIYDFLPKKTVRIFKLADKILPFQGYLKVIIFKKL